MPARTTALCDSPSQKWKRINVRKTAGENLGFAAIFLEDFSGDRDPIVADSAGAQHLRAVPRQKAAARKTVVSMTTVIGDGG